MTRMPSPTSFLKAMRAAVVAAEATGTVEALESARELLVGTWQGRFSARQDLEVARLVSRVDRKLAALGGPRVPRSLPSVTSA
jgi:hypothetical protein